MSPTSISSASVPTISGDPAALGSAAQKLTSLAPDIESITGSVTLAWKGVATDAYDAPEAPAARQSIPKIDAPMDTISANLATVGSKLETAAATIKSLQDRRDRLLARIASYNTSVARYDSDDEADSGWAKELSIERSEIVAEISQLRADITSHSAELAATLAGVKAPDPKLPEGQIVAGEAAGNYRDAHGPNAEASAMSEHFVDENGVHYWGAGAKAKAELFGAEAGFETRTSYGDYSGGASIGAGAEAEAHAAANASWATGAHGQAAASASVGVNGEFNADAEYGVLSGSIKGEGLVGAEASANIGGNIGPDGISASAGLHGFAGARGGGSLEAGVSGASVKAGADVRAGIGLDVDGSASVGWKEASVKFDVGGAIGIGGGVKVDVTIKPDEIVRDVADLFDVDVDAAADEAVDTAKEWAGDAAGSVGDLVGSLKPW